MDVEKYMEQPVRTTRSSTMSRIQTQLAAVGQNVSNMKKYIAAFSVLTAVFAGAVFGITLSANELSKDTIPSHNVLVNKETNEPIQVATISRVKQLDDMSIDQLKRIENVEFEDTDGLHHILKVTGIVYDPNDLNTLMFNTHEGKFGVDKNGVFSPIYEGLETPSRKLNGVTEECRLIHVGRFYSYWSPAGCNDEDGSSGSTGSTYPFTSGTEYPVIATTDLEDIDIEDVETEW